MRPSSLILCLKILKEGCLTTEEEAQIFNTACTFSPLVQHEHKGCFFLDIHGMSRLFGTSTILAAVLRNTVLKSCTLESTAAIASTTSCALLAAKVLNAPGTILIPEGEEAAFLSSQDVQLLEGLRPKQLRLLQSVGIHSLGELAQLSPTEGRALLGKIAIPLLEQARGTFSKGLTHGAEHADGIMREIKLQKATSNTQILYAALGLCAQRITQELRLRRLLYRYIHITLFYADGVQAYATQHKNIRAAIEEEVLNSAINCYKQADTRRVSITHIRLRVSNLIPDIQQDLLLTPARAKFLQLQTALDSTRRRYGEAALIKAAFLGALDAHQIGT